MRFFVSVSLLAVLGALVVALEPGKDTAAFSKLAGDNRKLIEMISAREKRLTRVTEHPFSTDFAVLNLCRVPLPEDLPEANPHRGHTIHVYVTPVAEEIIRTGKGTYPVGTLIVKEKFPGAFPRGAWTDAVKNDTPKTELFTAMLKREAGYHKECGDWEFMVVTGDLQQVAARGKIDSCVDCHLQYKNTDYVTRTYIR